MLQSQMLVILKHWIRRLKSLKCWWKRQQGLNSSDLMKIWLRWRRREINTRSKWNQINQKLKKFKKRLKS